MWLVKRALTLFFLFSVSLLAQGQSSLSPKDSIINHLTTYQNSLLQVKQQIADLQMTISNLSKTIETIKTQLDDSNNQLALSLEQIVSLKANLMESQALLEKSQKDLALQQTLYNQSSMDLKKLKVSYALSHSWVILLGSVLSASLSYEAGRVFKLWK